MCGRQGCRGGQKRGEGGQALQAPRWTGDDAGESVARRGRQSNGITGTPEHALVMVEQLTEGLGVTLPPVAPMLVVGDAATCEFIVYRDNEVRREETQGVERIRQVVDTDKKRSRLEG
ncbi:hypothetical protein E2562_031245 [Oryza meyeriana var. granulata]|uniref:Uncharacterized protein n=1 Tax=Oryza meyeriana var. granulata TaxID=110450 RepID=A0A6G1DPI8_9ORYZ|nr:hypothetical protein E2562_031245 [Oryza meyeriana var. granulata]